MLVRNVSCIYGMTAKTKRFQTDILVLW